MKLSNIIEEFINQMLNEAGGGVVELQRNALADKFSCVPSQINYVISTRFSPERGYVVESRRGGGGYIKISRVAINNDGIRLMHVINSIGGAISYSNAEAIINNCFDYDLIDQREAKIILSAVSDKTLALKQPMLDAVRARILKNVLANIAAV